MDEKMSTIPGKETQTKMLTSNDHESGPGEVLIAVKVENIDREFEDHSRNAEIPLDNKYLGIPVDNFKCNETDKSTVSKEPEDNSTGCKVENQEVSIKSEITDDAVAHKCDGADTSDGAINIYTVPRLETNVDKIDSVESKKDVLPFSNIENKDVNVSGGENVNKADNVRGGEDIQKDRSDTDVVNIEAPETALMDYREQENVVVIDDTSDPSPDSSSEDEHGEETVQNGEETTTKINKLMSNEREQSPDRDKRVKLNKHGFEDIRTKGEILPEELPPLEELTITVDESVVMVEVGSIKSIVGVLVVIQSNETVQPLNEDTILFLDGHTVLGQVFEVFGPVKTPWYSVRFNEVDSISNKGLKVGMKIYCAPQENAFTKFVFVDNLKSVKGSDASWEDNNEPPEKHLDFSDDESEKRAKAKRRNKKGEAIPDNEESEDHEGKKKRHRVRNRQRSGQQVRDNTENSCQPRNVNNQNRNPFWGNNSNSSVPRFNRNPVPMNPNGHQPWNCHPRNFARPPQRFGARPEFQNSPQFFHGQTRPNNGVIPQSNNGPLNQQFRPSPSNNGPGMGYQSPSMGQMPPAQYCPPTSEIFGQRQCFPGMSVPVPADFSRPPPPLPAPAAPPASIGPAVGNIASQMNQVGPPQNSNLSISLNCPPPPQPNMNGMLQRGSVPAQMGSIPPNQGPQGAPPAYLNSIAQIGASSSQQNQVKNTGNTGALQVPSTSNNQNVFNVHSLNPVPAGNFNFPNSQSQIQNGTFQPAVPSGGQQVGLPNSNTFSMGQTPQNMNFINSHGQGFIRPGTFQPSFQTGMPGFNQGGLAVGQQGSFRSNSQGFGSVYQSQGFPGSQGGGMGMNLTQTNPGFPGQMPCSSQMNGNLGSGGGNIQAQGQPITGQGLVTTGMNNIVNKNAIGNNSAGAVVLDNRLIQNSSK